MYLKNVNLEKLDKAAFIDILFLIYKQIDKNMYTVTRQDAADMLQISVRSVDRYIKSGKLRIKKEWKNIAIHSADIENMKNWWKSKHHVIINNSTAKNSDFSHTNTYATRQTIPEEKELSTWNEKHSLSLIYADLRDEIWKKDEIIQNLAVRVWKAEEIAKNSISINDFKKSQFLLEESKSALNSELESVKNQKDKLSQDLQYEKQVKFIFAIMSILLFIVAFYFWVNSI